MRPCLRLIKDESGIALVTSLLILMSLTALGVFAINATIVNQDISANLKASKQEFYLAEAGLQHAQRFLAQNIGQWPTYATATFQTMISCTQLYLSQDNTPQTALCTTTRLATDTVLGTYTVTIQDAGLPSPSAVGSRRVLSTGTTSPTGTTSSQGQAVIEALFGNNPSFPCDLCSQGNLVLKGTSIINSFDSRLGTYSAQTPTQHGDVAASGTVTLSGNATVQGNAVAGSTVTCGNQSCVGTGQVTGTITNSAPKQYFPPVNPCGAYTPDTDLRIHGGTYANGQLQGTSSQAITLDPGTYCFNNVQITGQATLTVNGPVQIYVTADSTFAGNGIVNTTEVAANLRIFSSLGSPSNPVSNQGITLTGGSSASAAVYAPYSYVKFTGGSDFYGSAVGYDIDAGTGNTHFHYDLALTALPNSGLGLISWRQVF